MLLRGPPHLFFKVKMIQSVKIMKNHNSLLKTILMYKVGRGHVYTKGLGAFRNDYFLCFNVAKCTLYIVLWGGVPPSPLRRW